MELICPFYASTELCNYHLFHINAVCIFFFFSHFLDDKILADMKSLEGFLSLATNTVSGS